MEGPQLVDKLRLAIAGDPRVVHEQVGPLDLPTRFTTKNGTRTSADRSGALLDFVACASQLIDLDIRLVRIVMYYQHAGHQSAPFRNPLAWKDAFGRQAAR